MHQSFERWPAQGHFRYYGRRKANGQDIDPDLGIIRADFEFLRPQSGQVYDKTRTGSDDRMIGIPIILSKVRDVTQIVAGHQIPPRGSGDLSTLHSLSNRRWHT
ncbi:MAG: hypothetical protein M3247_09185, partial [Thermoproteota archaeon]|nr:hypothetical protein [Thermoproteota archaeon]